MENLKNYIEAWKILLPQFRHQILTAVLFLLPFSEIYHQEGDLVGMLLLPHSPIISP